MKLVFPFGDQVRNLLHGLGWARVFVVLVGLCGSTLADAVEAAGMGRGFICEAVPAKAAVEQGIPLEIKIELVANPERLAPKVKHLNAFRIRNYVTLHLTNRVTKETHKLDLEEFHGPAPYDDLSQVKRLDGRLGPWVMEFRLVRLREELKPGRYDCAIEFVYPDRPHQHWQSSGKSEREWEEFGFWHGRILSASFGLEILPETPKTKEFVVPRNPRLEKLPDGSQQLIFRKEDVVSIEREVHNGLFIGQRIDFPIGMSLSGVSDWGEEDFIVPIPIGTDHVNFRVTIFETDRPPGRPWSYEASKYYKVLWQVNYETNLVRMEGGAVPSNAEAELSLGLRDVISKLQQRFPELKEEFITHGKQSVEETPTVWQGEEYASIGQRIELARYPSATDAQQALEKSLHLRPAVTPKAQNYRGAALYKFTQGVGNIVCQYKQYIIEIRPQSFESASMEFRILDLVLSELGAPSARLK